VRSGVPEYARPGDAAYVEHLRIGVEQALTLFLELIGVSAADGEAIVGTFRELGRLEARAGRSLDALQAALRLGGQAAWRVLARDAERAGLDAATLAALADVAFTVIHQVAEAAAVGHAEAQQSGDVDTQHYRARLLALLLGDAPARPETVNQLARGAGWRLPGRVVVLAAEPPSRRSTGRLLLPPRVLSDLSSRPARLLVPEDEAPGALRGRALTVALRGRAVAVGPAVPLAEAADSLRWATRALGLMRRGVLPRKDLLYCADHLSTLLLYADEALQQALSRRVLAPLAELPAPQRERLTETALAWLQSGRSVATVADRLHVHPQTVRYRLRRLDELFGDRLRDPDCHLDLELALRAEALRAPRSARPGGAAAG
jgi:DNA-binding CsgD family transcriptional regulator